MASLTAKPAVRYCIPSGYRFEFQRPAGSFKHARTNVRRTKNDDWEVTMGKAMCGRLVGHRLIDGSVAAVVMVGTKLYAAQSRYVRKLGKR